MTWARKNLFSSPFSCLLTVCFTGLAVWLVSQFLSFALIKAVWCGDSEVCRANPDGACWSFIGAKLNYLRYGAYPATERWRVDFTQLIGAALMGWLLWRSAPRRNIAALLFFGIYPIAAFTLLRGVETIGLPVVDTTLWGGMMITLLMSVVGIVFSLPLGILLALGRRSELPIVKAACVFYIEVVRGVPFITVLFMANFMMPLFVPEALTPDRLLRPMIGTAFFSAAYMAEVIRAGLQAIPNGQYEGAQALGVGYFTMMRLIILPQALTIVIPGIVSTFIGLFKDTTLVAIVGIADFLRAVETARIDPAWAGPTISSTGYLFAAIIYWAFCFGMSRYSMSVERHLARGHKS
ncbi:amino acid ABC transporter permease [Rhizobium binae]|nr:amino acid ABC transporter permease [Rhizobium binae]MBX4943558.1 amino acid ABC transporter permease [Rhizobium binae]MBX4961283.1 amino acid ABC transporter permease [Rhizobium binae]MBX4966219.1 amino acid ABC transporter permease [Rhizobium binae]MBX4982299.1 amino acid ABC transporter permease [Rhizobium binae]